MLKKFKNYLIYLLISIVALIFLIATQWPDNKTHLIFCDVGQGDAILITSGFNQVLIDTGEGQNISECLKNHLPFWDRQIEVILITHMDSDHVGALSYLLESFLIKKLMINDFASQTQPFLAAKKLIQNNNWQNSEIIIVDSLIDLYTTNMFNLRNLSLNTKTTLSDAEENKNAHSIVLLLEVGKIKVLLTGDMEKENEQALLAQGLITDIDILKVAHHGSKSSSTLEFLQLAQPEISVISVGENNRYGHPHQETLNNLAKINSQILRTDQLGTIEIVSDGQSYWIQ